RSRTQGESAPTVRRRSCRFPSPLSGSHPRAHVGRVRSMRDVPPEPADHPDRRRWNAKYAARSYPSFAAHPLAARALSIPPPAGPVLDLACGTSGSALLAAEDGRPVTGVDISDVALGLLGAEARRRGLGELITLIHADVRAWRPRDRFPFVLCTG